MVLATEVNAEVFNIKMTDIADSAFINDGPKNVKDLFEYMKHKAKENPTKKIIIILDEMEALLKKRS
jgi:ATP-dependent 26S proteasome regulatory subunit